MDIGLFLAWSDQGTNLDKLTDQLEGKNLHGLLDCLERLVRSKFDEASEVLPLYADWLTHAHSIRALRNQFIHGRWGFVPASLEVANVVGLPTSGDQKEFRYSISDLSERLSELRNLRGRLGELRRTHPV
jgi:hypothetical protein